MLSESCRDIIYKRGMVLLAVGAVALIGTGAVAARVQDPLHRVVAPGVAHMRVPAEAKSQPHTRPRATISLYEHTADRTTLRRQGCSAAKRGVGGIVILDFGQPAYNGHTYGTY